MRFAALALAATLGVLPACGDDGGTPATDAAPDTMTLIDAPIDAPPEVTLTSFVIDLVQNQTAGNTDPVPYATFSGLNDPDQANPAAYNVLFP